MYAPSIIALLLIANSLAFKHGEDEERRKFLRNGYEGQTRFFDDMVEPGKWMVPTVHVLQAPATDNIIDCLIKSISAAETEVKQITEMGEEDWLTVKKIMIEVASLELLAAGEDIVSLLRQIPVPNINESTAFYE